MKKHLLVNVLFGAISFFVITASPAQTIKFVNHYGKTLQFRVQTGEEYLSDLGREFSIESGSYLSSSLTIPTSGPSAPPKNEQAIYISVKRKYVPVFVANAFFSLGLYGVNNNGAKEYKVHVSGYLDKRIAYSWTPPTKDAVIIFCKPEAFAQHKKCI